VTVHFKPNTSWNGRSRPPRATPHPRWRPPRRASTRLEPESVRRQAAWEVIAPTLPRGADHHSVELAPGRSLGEPLRAVGRVRLARPTGRAPGSGSAVRQGFTFKGQLRSKVSCVPLMVRRASSSLPSCRQYRSASPTVPIDMEGRIAPTKTRWDRAASCRTGTDGRTRTTATRGPQVRDHPQGLDEPATAIMGVGTEMAASRGPSGIGTYACFRRRPL
jgi:hypothetical protein